MAIRIRRAGRFEAAELTEIAFAAKRHWGYPEEWIQLWADELTVDADYVGQNRVFMAENDARKLGWCAVSQARDVGWLDYCWVLPEAMGHGIGRMLVVHAQELTARHGCDVLRVIADPNAEGFYRRLGFRRVGDHPSRPDGRTLPVLEARSAMAGAASEVTEEVS